MNAPKNTNDRLVLPAEHAAKCPALDGYPCCCSITGAAALDEDPEATLWNWLRGVINGLPSTLSGYCQLIARHDVLAWIDEGERRALSSRPEAPAAPTSQPNAPEFSELMAMPEEQIDAELRALGIDPEDAARKAGTAIASAVEIAEQMRIAKKGATCPLCGRNFPHKHSPEEITIYRNGMKASRTSQPNAAAQEQQAGWMPIESAPKDGRSVLIANDAPGSVHPREAYYVAPERRYENEPKHAGWWRLAGSCEERVHGRTPTHWMPLPPAPTGMGSVGLPSGRGEEES